MLLPAVNREKPSSQCGQKLVRARVHATDGVNEVRNYYTVANRVVFDYSKNNEADLSPRTMVPRSHSPLKRDRGLMFISCRRHRVPEQPPQYYSLPKPT
ncbi:unnamed protein product [Nesidiocoris tenuis]|uniref:Uncharacterized protein n=1 Tax=Nesidiocoris tenuis TaxID=355587 RepID=A0A6H5H3I8_9HEMI|nr:unnamed protein product [Nesidiocoris tenuis]